jgi:hypothetical protein
MSGVEFAPAVTLFHFPRRYFFPSRQAGGQGPSTNVGHAAAQHDCSPAPATAPALRRQAKDVYRTRTLQRLHLMARECHWEQSAVIVCGNQTGHRRANLYLLPRSYLVKNNLTNRLWPSVSRGSTATNTFSIPLFLLFFRSRKGYNSPDLKGRFYG